MPIRFRCAYCNQLMGIARRKAGTVVSCPTCHGQVVVPTPEPPLQPVQMPPPPGNGPAGPANVFDRQDFDAGMFNPKPIPAPPPAPSPPRPVAELSLHATVPTPAPLLGSSGFDVEPVVMGPSNAPPRGLVLTPSKMVLAVGALLLLALAFAAGLICGKMF
jgi:hypothetical protein